MMAPMKTFFFLIILSVLAVLSSCTRTDSNAAGSRNDSLAAADKTSSAKEYYTCPMHPSVVSDRPGACPVCGMALVKKSAEQEISSSSLANIEAVSLSPTQRVVANVTTTTVERRSLNKEINAVGVVDFAEPLQATVSARFRGRIEKLYVNFTGDVVHKGQPLFELYSPDLVSAEQEFILALDAMNSAIASNNDADVQQSRQAGQLLQAARDRLRVHFGTTEQQIADIEAKKQVRYAVTFDSPIHGTVIRKEIQEGQYVDEGMMLYQLADLSKVWIYLEVYEKDVRFIKLGQVAQITSEAYPNESFSGRVTFIDPVMNGETRTVRVRTEFANPNGELKPQMYVKAQITVPITNAIIIPASAVLSTGKRSVVWVEVQPNMFEPRDVVFGEHTDSFCEVLSGLKRGETIVVTGGFLLDSESQLQQSTSAEPKGGLMAHENGSHAMAENGKVNILVKGRYSPDVIHVKQGQKVKLLFYRDEDADCTNEVVFEELNIRRHLPARTTTTVEITPKDTGEIHFVCGMGMVRGKLVVEK